MNIRFSLFSQPKRDHIFVHAREIPLRLLKPYCSHVPYARKQQESGESSKNQIRPLCMHLAQHEQDCIQWTLVSVNSAYARVHHFTKSTPKSDNKQKRVPTSKTKWRYRRFSCCQRPAGDVMIIRKQVIQDVKTRFINITFKETLHNKHLSLHPTNRTNMICL